MSVYATAIGNLHPPEYAIPVDKFSTLGLSRDSNFIEICHLSEVLSNDVLEETMYMEALIKLREYYTNLEIGHPIRRLSFTQLQIL